MIGREGKGLVALVSWLCLGTSALPACSADLSPPALALAADRAAAEAGDAPETMGEALEPTGMGGRPDPALDDAAPSVICSRGRRVAAPVPAA